VGAVVRVVAGLVVLAIGAAWWGLSRPQPEPVAESADWARPESVAAWARKGLAADGLAQCSVIARLDAHEGAGRRLLEVTCTGDVDPPKALEALARLLLRAREGGERTATQAVVSEIAGRVILLPVGEAARLSNDLEAATAWWLPGGSKAAGSADGKDGSGTPGGQEMGPPAPQASLAAAAQSSTIAQEADANDAPEPSVEQASAEPDVPVAPVPPPAVAVQVPPPPVVGAAPAASAPAGSAPRGSGVRIARAPGRSTSGPLRAGQSAATLLRVQISTSVRRALTLESITLRAGGTLQDAEALTSVRLVRESDPTGRMPGQGESLPSQASFAADDGTVRFDGLGENFGEDGTAMSIAVIADIAPTARGGSIELVVPDGSGVVVVDAAGEAVRVDGVPLRGARAWVAGAIVPRPQPGEDANGEDAAPREPLPERPEEP
jgi:hypothetical protein